MRYRKAKLSQMTYACLFLSLPHSQESEDVVSELTYLLRTYPPSDGWRVWLSVHAGSVTSLPVSLLHGVCRVVLDTPSVSDIIVYEVFSLFIVHYFFCHGYLTCCASKHVLLVLLCSKPLTQHPSYNPLFLLPCYMQLLSPFPPPQSLKGSLLYTLASLPPDLFSASTRVEWLPLLHSSALLFPLLRTRREMHTISWRYCPPLPHTLLTVSTYTPTHGNMFTP